jgi:CPA1 family monovalent cation:H+ antiporter
MLAHSLATMLALLFAVVLFTTVARRLRLPYPSLLALGGLVMALIPRLPRLQLDPDVVLLVFLPPLLFGAGWRISWSELVQQLRPITVLAIGLVLFTTVGVGIAAHALDHTLPLGAALVLVAIVSPTDPLAASAVARQVRLPKWIITVLEGESLANDATGLVVYRIAVAAVATGSFGVLGGAYTFVLVATGGVAIGLVIGFISVRLQRLVEDPPIEFALQFLTGYAAYLPAERLGLSGVFAAAAAGLICGHHWSYAPGARSRLQAVAVWDTLDFLLNAVLFLLLGMQLPVVLAEAGDHDIGRLVLTGIGVSVLAIGLRMGWMFTGALLSRLRAGAEAPPANIVALLGWSGMRGVLSLATALAVPRKTISGAAFPGRATILFYAFSVIVVTLIVQGLPLPWVMRWLRIPREEPRLEEEERIARIRIARAARDRLERLIADGDELTRQLATDLRARYKRMLEHFEAEATSGQAGRMQLELMRIRRELTHAQRRVLLDLHARRLIDSDTFRRIERELDLEEPDEGHRT